MTAFPYSRQSLAMRLVLLLISWCWAANLQAQPPGQADERLPSAMPAPSDMFPFQNARSVVAIARARKQKSPRQQSALLLQKWNHFAEGLEKGSPNGMQPTSLHALRPIPRLTASGIVWDSQGSIVTSYRGLDDPRENHYWVGLRIADQEGLRWIPASVIAADPYSDLAVLQVDDKTLLLEPWDPVKPVSQQFERPEAGSSVVCGAYRSDSGGSVVWVAGEARWFKNYCIPASAIEPFQPSHFNSTTDSLDRFGILSAVNVSENIATAGGGVFDFQGQLVAMTFGRSQNDSKYWSVDQGEPSPLIDEHRNGAGSDRDQGSLLVFPCDQTFQRVVEALKHGKLPEYGFLGVQPDEPRQAVGASDHANGPAGARIKTVVRGMPGDLAGVRDGDTIKAIEGRRIVNRESLFRELSRYDANAQVRLDILRGESGSTHAEPISLQVRLSKKYIATQRPAYSIKPEPNWRGMRVEYSTALSPEMMRTPLRVKGGLAPGSIAVLSVEPQTPAWRAGLRSGQLISLVEGEVVSSPQDFYQRMESMSGRSVRLQIVSYREKLEEVVVPIE